MRALKSIVIAGLAFMSLASHGIEQTLPAKYLLIEVHGKYADRWIRVYREGGRWICQTSDLPHLEPKDNPLQNLDWKRLASESKQADPGCRDRVTLTDALERQPKKLSSCLDLPRMKFWVNSVSRRCGSF